MRARWAGVVAAALCAAGGLWGQVHRASGVVVGWGKAGRTVVVSCDAIAGYMGPMEMSFRVEGADREAGIKAGDAVEFLMEQRGRELVARGIRVVPGANLEEEPMQAGGLTALQGALKPSSVVAQGGVVPDFELTDQVGREVRLSGLAGKVVVLTFGYSRCPNPEYCFRLSDNLSRVRGRFGSRMPRDLVLLTIAIDPEHDRGATLVEYAAVWKANPASWHFLTGPLPEIRQVAGMFGMNFWRDEGLLTHSLHTVVIDRSGRLAANLEGNHFSVQQLGDLVEQVMDERVAARVGR